MKKNKLPNRGAIRNILPNMPKHPGKSLPARGVPQEISLPRIQDRARENTFIQREEESSSATYALPQIKQSSHKYNIFNQKENPRKIRAKTSHGIKLPTGGTVGGGDKRHFLEVSSRLKTLIQANGEEVISPESQDKVYQIKREVLPDLPQGRAVTRINRSTPPTPTEALAYHESRLEDLDKRLQNYASQTGQAIAEAYQAIGHIRKIGEQYFGKNDIPEQEIEYQNPRLLARRQQEARHVARKEGGDEGFYLPSTQGAGQQRDGNAVRRAQPAHVGQANVVSQNLLYKPKPPQGPRPQGLPNRPVLNQGAQRNINVAALRPLPTRHNVSARTQSMPLHGNKSIRPLGPIANKTMQRGGHQGRM